jgi:hypothetical protein
VVIEMFEDQKLVAEEGDKLLTLRAAREVLEGGGEDGVRERLRARQGKRIEKRSIDVGQLLVGSEAACPGAGAYLAEGQNNGRMRAMRASMKDLEE